MQVARNWGPVGYFTQNKNCKGAAGFQLPTGTAASLNAEGAAQGDDPEGASSGLARPRAPPASMPCLHAGTRRRLQSLQSHPRPTPPAPALATATPAGCVPLEACPARAGSVAVAGRRRGSARGRPRSEATRTARGDAIHRRVMHDEALSNPAGQGTESSTAVLGWLPRRRTSRRLDRRVPACPLLRVVWWWEGRMVARKLALCTQGRPGRIRPGSICLRARECTCVSDCRRNAASRPVPGGRHRIAATSTAAWANESVDAPRQGGPAGDM